MSAAASNVHYLLDWAKMNLGANCRRARGAVVRRAPSPCCGAEPPTRSPYSPTVCDRTRTDGDARRGSPATALRPCRANTV